MQAWELLNQNVGYSHDGYYGTLSQDPDGPYNAPPDYAVTKKLNAEGGNPGGVELRWTDLLALAVNHGDIDVARLVLFYGAYTFSNVLSVIAHENNSAEMVRLLLLHLTDKTLKADLLTKTYREGKCPRLIEGFLKMDYRAIEAQIDGLKSLQFACRHGHSRIAELLLEYGANTLVEGDGLGTLLHLAAEQGSVDIVSLLFRFQEELKFDKRDNGGFRKTPLHIACHNGHEEVLKSLIAHGANVNASIANDGSETALHIATKQNRVEIVSTLLQHGADTEHKMALHLAAETGNVEITKLLLDNMNRRKIDSIAMYQRTPLMLALLKHHIPVMQLLIDRGAEFDTMDVNGNTLLDHVVDGSTEDLNLVRFLPDNLDVSLFENFNERKMTPLGVAAFEGKVNVLKLVFEKYGSVDVDFKNEHGRTTLHFAAIYGERGAMEVLINHEADINAKDNDGWTPLHYAYGSFQSAAGPSRAEVAEFLLEKGSCS
ncbi:ankyrin repeat-containing domain protein [Podospora fimiseda]|uniref:Ankyrin repeat-containing domain protein n=1 Tax=Podospora fimiseda TaxID=252190 RepID=A0AAN7GZ96_9PEZI|nr:ankyrin repeat-containing domain protein [Podospora fimiseda]